MSITAAIVLYAVIWFICLFVALPIRLTTQQEDGEIVPGTPASAPSNPQIARKMKWTTLAATILWSVICAVILWGGITIRDLDVWGRM